MGHPKLSGIRAMKLICKVYSIHFIIVIYSNLRSYHSDHWLITKEVVNIFLVLVHKSWSATYP